MLVVLLMVLFLSLFYLLLSPLTLMHHQSVLHYGDSLRLEHLAYGVRDLCLEELEGTWPEVFDSGWRVWSEEEAYRYRIEPLETEQCLLTVQVRNGDVERTFSGILILGEPVDTLLDLTEYGIYSSQDLSLLDLSRIKAPLTMDGIACHKNLKISEIEGENRLNLLVNGNIYLESIRWEYFHNSYMLYRSLIPAYNEAMIREFIYLLKNRCGDKMSIVGNQNSLSLNLNTFEQTGDILVVEQVEDLHLQGSFCGLMILQGCRRVTLDSFDLSGLLIVSGSEGVQMDNTRIQGSLALVDSNCAAPLDLSLDYSLESLSDLEEFLTIENFREQHSGRIYVQEFNETP